MPELAASTQAASGAYLVFYAESSGRRARDRGGLSKHHLSDGEGSIVTELVADLLLDALMALFGVALLSRAHSERLRALGLYGGE
jgi:hypothetical protein